MSITLPPWPYKKKPLSDEERRIGYAKYYDMPLAAPLPIYLQMLGESPLPEEKVIPAQRFLDYLNEDQGDAVVGYRVMEDGSAYNTHYAYFPNLTMEMVAWWYQWLPVKTKGAPEGCGNLKYKLWCPPDHEDYRYMKDAEGKPCLCLMESFGLGSGPVSAGYRYKLTPEQVGLTPERQKELATRGCVYNFSMMTDGATQWKINANYTRPHPAGGIEMRQCNWFGYRMQDGQVVRDLSKPQEPKETITQRMIRLSLHNIVEIDHLSRLLPPLYAEYHNKPFDEP